MPLVTSAFDTAFAAVVGVEGAYSSDPSDPGNWTGGVVGSGKLRGTKYGISAAAYPTLDIASLTLDAAKALYRANYWNPISGDELPGPIAFTVFDCAVNQGLTAAKIILQQALDVEADSVIGPETIAAATRQDNNPQPTVLEIGARRALRYAQTSGLATFGLGWMRRVFTITSQALAA